jgi:hypothetical protein
MIVKIQTPLASSLPPEQHSALIYNKDRDYKVMMPITDEIDTWMQGRPKAFFEIKLGFEGYGFTIEREVGEQGW